MDSTFNVIIEEIVGTLPDVRHLARAGWRLLAALLAGAIIGYQREQVGKAAGLRTHLLVAMGTSLFVICAIEYGMQQDALSRVIQGIITGIGFLGTAAIIKREQQHEVHGITTAAGIWITAAVSIAIGMGQIVVGLIGTALAWVVLAMLYRIQPRKPNQPNSEH
jgi:putative Mg2+ transporter-C (MgtC) family protein